MIGRMYVNEIAPQAASLEFSLWPSGALDETDPYGFAYRKALEHLKLTHRIVGGRQLLLAGSVEQLQTNAPLLHKHIGVIARYGAEKDEGLWPDSTRDYLGRMLGRLTQTTVPQFPEGTPFVDAAAAITAPFADATNDSNELFYVIKDDTPWWYDQEAIDKRELAIADFLEAYPTEAGLE